MVSWPNRPRTVSETFDKRRTGERVGLLFLASFPNKRFRKSSLAFWVAKGLQFDLVREGRGSGGRGGVEGGRGRGRDRSGGKGGVEGRGSGSEWREGGSGGRGGRDLSGRKDESGINGKKHCTLKGCKDNVWENGKNVFPRTKNIVQKPFFHPSSTR